jgi:hypothetical protein
VEGGMYNHLTWREAYSKYFLQVGAPAIADLEEEKRGFRDGWLDSSLGTLSFYAMFARSARGRAYRIAVELRARKQ